MKTLLSALAVVACLTGSSFAQTIVYETYSPVVTSYAAPTVAYRPISGTTYTNYYPSYTTYSPVVTETYSPVVTSYSPVVTAYSPVVTAYSPVVTSYSPVVTAYSPVVTTYSPVVTAAPVVTSYYVPTVVRSKVLYVPGQPVRNFFRARTP
jgi:hypothetical protein